MVGRGHSLCRRSNARVPGDPRLYARARTSLWDTKFVLAGTRLLLRTLGMEQRHAWPRLHLGDRRAGCRSLLHRAAPVCSCRPGLRRWVWLSPQFAVVDRPAVPPSRANRATLAGRDPVCRVGGYPRSRPDGVHHFGDCVAAGCLGECQCGILGKNRKYPSSGHPVGRLPFDRACWSRYRLADHNCCLLDLS